MHEYLPFEATKNNHLRYRFGHTQDSMHRRHGLDVASMTMGGIASHGGSFVDCICATATELASRHHGQLLVFLSGGLDSEVAVRSLVVAQQDFRAVVLRFSNELNQDDVSSALRLCDHLGIQPLVIDLDPLDFYSSGRWTDMARKHQCHTFYQQMLCHVAEDLACPLLTVDEIELIRLSPGKWAFTKKEDQDGCWHRFMYNTGIPAYNNFYTYDPSTMLAFMSSPTVRELVHDRIFGKLTWSSSKNAIYKELTGWDMVPRPKRHGMEKMMDIWYSVQNQASLLLPGPPVEFVFDANDLVTALRRGEAITCAMI